MPLIAPDQRTDPEEDWLPQFGACVFEGVPEPDPEDPLTAWFMRSDEHE